MPFISSEELNSAEIFTLEQKDTFLYIGTDQGLYIHKGDTTEEIPNLPAQHIEDIVFDNWERPWCIIEGRVYVLCDGYWCECVLNWLDTLSGGKATSLEMGITDIIIGTNRGKIFQIDSREPSTKDTIMYVDSTSSDTLIYTDSIVEIRPSSIFEANGRYYEGVNTIYHVRHYRRGLYLISTSNGIFLYNSLNRELLHAISFERLLPSPYITLCAEAETDSIFWFAGTNEIFKIEETTGDSIIIMRDSIPNVHIIHLGSHRRLWCSSDDKIYEISTNSLAFLEYDLPEKFGNSAIGEFTVTDRQVLLAIGSEVQQFISEPPKLKVEILMVKRRNNQHVVVFKVENSEYYPHIITQRSIDYKEWQDQAGVYAIRIETKNDTTYILFLGDLSNGNHDVRVRVRAPFGDETFVQDTFEFRVLPLVKTAFPKGLLELILIITVPAVALVITGLVFFLKYLRRRREQMLIRAKQQLTKNPYIVGRPVQDPKLFIGRQKILRSIMRGIYYNSFVIEGERRIGKTSVLHQIYRRLKGRKSSDYITIPVFISLQRIEKSKPRTNQKIRVINFYTHLVQEIAKETNYDGDIMDEYDSGRFVSFIEALGPFLKTKYRNKKVRVVLLIDEADKMKNYGKNFHENFRGVFQTISSLFINIVLALYDYSPEWNDITSPWFNFFIPSKKLPPLTQLETYNLAQGYVKDSLHYTRWAKKAIWEYTTGNPHLIQLLCSEIYDNLGEKEVTIRIDLVKKAYRNIKPQIKKLYNAE